MDKKAEANKHLENAGMYGRTIVRWWNGFYHNRIAPTPEETLALPLDEITAIVINGSRREFKY